MARHVTLNHIKILSLAQCESVGCVRDHVYVAALRCFCIATALHSKSPPDMHQAAAGMQVDVWALGVSAIEMAETIPPRWSVHPMRVIFQISREDPPRLAEWERWSLTLHDFVRLCLIKDCRARPTAAQLEQHKLAAQARAAGPPDLSPLVARARQFIQAKAAAAADDTFATTARGSTFQGTLECVPRSCCCLRWQRRHPCSRC